MRAKTAEGKRLKRLVNRYAKAVEARSWMGSMDSVDHEAKKLLFDEIDRLTSISLTPRSLL